MHAASRQQPVATAKAPCIVGHVQLTVEFGVALEQLNGVLVASWWEESAASPSGHPAGADRTESAHIAGVNRPAVVLGTGGSPHGRPAESVFAANPKIRKLVETDPKIVPHVNLIAQFQQAQAEAEVAFRQRELTENWAEWSGPYPWAEEKDPDTTDCPWWVAGSGPVSNGRSSLDAALAFSTD